MAGIGPIGSTIYANQTMHLQAQKQTSFQNRIDMQNLAAGETSNEKGKELRELRPTEAIYKIDPEREHQKEKNEEEAGEKQEEMQRDQKKSKEFKEQNEEPPSTTSILDIKA